jgi:hypothetical protein
MRRILTALALAGLGTPAAANAEPETAPRARVALTCALGVVENGKETTISRPKVTTLDGRAAKFTQATGADPRSGRRDLLLTIDLTPHVEGDAVRLEGTLALSAGGQPKSTQPITGDRVRATVPVDDAFAFNVACDATTEPAPASP